MKLIEEIFQTLSENKSSNAFCINGSYITYQEFIEYINGAFEIIESEIGGTNNAIGIVSYESIETYAAIFATWFSGNYIVPINPNHPLERNSRVLRNTEVKHVFSIKDDIQGLANNLKLQLLNNSGLKSSLPFEPVRVDEDQNMYILTTSGSTGIPKHVPISIKNVTSYRRAFLKMFPELYHSAHYLQTHDHTTDSAFTSYLLPLSVGGCIYLLPDNQFKFLSIAKLMTNKSINWIKLTPSVLSYLDSYIEKLDLKHIQYFCFVGEALQVSMVKKWWGSFPDAEIINYYGPTEATMLSTFFRFKKPDEIKSANGVVSIGLPFPEISCIVIDKNNNILTTEPGELCLGGEQIMKGYLKGGIDPFVYIEQDGVKKKYYRTGDLVQQDKDGYYYFLGRIDDQVKIQGYRINLIEVENAVRNIVKEHKIVAVASEKTIGIKRLYIFIEGYLGDCNQLKKEISKQLPPQMVPEEIISIKSIPFTASGKTDRKTLEKAYLTNERN